MILKLKSHANHNPIYILLMVRKSAYQIDYDLLFCYSESTWWMSWQYVDAAQAYASACSVFRIATALKETGDSLSCYLCRHRHFDRPQTKLREGNVFNHVCLSGSGPKIRSTGGRHVSYWNAYLSFSHLLLFLTACILTSVFCVCVKA